MSGPEPRWAISPRPRSVPWAERARPVVPGGAGSGVRGQPAAAGAARRRAYAARPPPPRRPQPLAFLFSAVLGFPAVFGFSAALGGGLLDRVEDRPRIAGDRLTQGGLDLVLHRGPAGLGRVVHRLRDVLQEGREHRVLRHGGGGALGGRQQIVLIVELKLVLVLIYEVEELLDRRLVASGVEGDDVVVHAERGGQRGAVARDVGRGVVRGLQDASRLDDRDHGGRAEHHADPSLGELGPHILTVRRAPALLRVARLRETAHEMPAP